MKSMGQEQTVGRPSRLEQVVLPILASFLGTLFALFPNNPVNMTLPSRDSGVFLYVGWRLLMGDVPYRDVWDHKPPLIYFVDALGLSLTPDSLWGVWVLQFIFVFLTLFFIYRALYLQFGTLAALTGTILLTSGLYTLLENGNVTEQYALVFQALGIWLFVKAWKDDFPPSASFWVGLCGGMAFNSKQTTIGLWVVYGLVLVVIRFRQRKFPLKDILFLFAGWIVPTLVFAAYLASQNALADFWQQAYVYNFGYIGKHEGIRRFIPIFVKGFALLRNGWVLHLAIAGWLASSAYLWLTRRNLFDPARSLVLIGWLSLPIEIFFVTISGRSIIHYYLTPLPAMAIVAGSLAYTIPFLFANVQRLNSPQLQRWIPVMILIAVLIGQVGQVQSYPQYMQTLSRNKYTGVLDFISANTQEGDRVLIIGAESVLNFLARRESPTRYVYQYPLALTGSRPMFEEYFNQILKNDPVLIIDTRGRSTLTEKLYVPLQKRSEIVRAGVEYFGANYEQVAQFGDLKIYRKIESP